MSTALTTRDKDALRKQEETAESARITISQCVDPVRRERCLKDPELFLKTYMAKKFRQPFGKLHEKLIEAIKDRAELGGKKAIAAPRSRGKSTIVKGMNVYLVCAELVRFIVPICATTKLAGRIYKDFRNELANNELLKEDFPEICDPIRALYGAPQRAARQHVDGHLTHIVWTATDYVRLPMVPGNANDYLQSLGREWSPYGGVKMTFCGLDAAFRGMNIDDERPDYLIIDDPETRESAKSTEQIEDRIEIIEKDIEGLEGQDKPIAMTMVTTVQNNFCLSAQYTDIERKPAWAGERYGWVEEWPKRSDLWAEYIEKRKESQFKGDRHAIDAVNFYLANKDEMDFGVKLLADNFKAIRLRDGTQVVHSAIQEVYNKIADTSLAAFQTEYQNDPPETVGPQGNGLTAELVSSRISGLAKRQLPANTTALTAAIDLGKYKCHWVVIAWCPGAGGVVVDYGIAEVSGTDKTIDNEASEPQIYKALLNWRDELLNKNYTDATGTIRKVDFVMVDSGTFTNAAYEFCRQVRGIFHPSKGINPYYPKKQSTANLMAGANLHAQRFAAQDIWLYELDTNHWKQWTHERFLTPTFDDNNMLRRGALSLYQPEGSQNHNSFAHHIAAEELVTEFKEGKGTTTKWNPKNDNNHWLDATYMAAAASEVCGVKLIAPSEVEVAPRHVDKDAPKVSNAQPKAYQHGTRFKKRPGGWIPRRR